MSFRLRDITDALNNQLLAGAITTEIAWPNAVYMPRKGISYLSVEMAARARSPLGSGVDAVQLWQGVYQVSVFVDRNTGTREQDALCDKVLAQFPRGLTLTVNSTRIIVEYSTAPTPVAFGDWSNLPASIHWFTTQP